MEWFFIILLGLLVIVVFMAIGAYNGLVGKKNKVSDQFAQIDVQLKRRFDLIPNLVETVKGYAAHEKSTFEAVIKARSQYMSAQTPAEKISANGELTQFLGKLFALAESYPELKANVNFLSLQGELSETENKISFARQFYNDTVLEYNNAVQMFPSNIFAGIFGFKLADFFKTDEGDKAVPKVQF